MYFLHYTTEEDAIFNIFIHPHTDVDPIYAVSDSFESDMLSYRIGLPFTRTPQPDMISYQIGYEARRDEQRQ